MVNSVLVNRMQVIACNWYVYIYTFLLTHKNNTNPKQEQQEMCVEQINTIEPSMMFHSGRAEQNLVESMQLPGN